MVMPLPVQYGHLKSDRSLHASANDLYVPGALAASYDIVPTFCVLTICLCADHLRRATACCEKNVPYIMQQTTQECLITCFSLQQDDSIGSVHCIWSQMQKAWSSSCTLCSKCTNSAASGMPPSQTSSGFHFDAVPDRADCIFLAAAVA